MIKFLLIRETRIKQKCSYHFSNWPDSQDSRYQGWEEDVVKALRKGLGELWSSNLQSPQPYFLGCTLIFAHESKRSISLSIPAMNVPTQNVVIQLLKNVEIRVQIVRKQARKGAVVFWRPQKICACIRYWLHEEAGCENSLVRICIWIYLNIYFKVKIRFAIPML